VLVIRKLIKPAITHQCVFHLASSTLTLLVGRQEGHPACKKTGLVICLKLFADLHMAQLMPLPLTVSSFSKIQIGFIFLVLAHPCVPCGSAKKSPATSYTSLTAKGA